VINRIQGRSSFLLPGLFAAVLCLQPQVARAAISIKSLPSHLNPSTDYKTTATIFAGKSSDTSTCSGTLSTSPCDTCAAVTTVAATSTCNKTSIYPNHVFTVSFSSDNAAAFTASSKVMMENGSVSINPFNITTQTLAVNTVIEAQFKWSDICSNFGSSGDSNCDTSFSKSVTIGISKDNTITGMTDSFTLQINFRSLSSANANFTPTFHPDCSTVTGVGATQYGGVCGFTVSPGDSKVYFGNVLVPLSSAGSSINSWPSTESAGVNWAGMMSYYRAASAQPASDSAPASNEWGTLAPGGGDTYVASLAINADGSMPKTRVTGLANDTSYVFMIASYDQAGNIAYFSNVVTTTDDFFVPANTGIHYGRPGAVVGLLDNKKCFIATAAFGSEMEPRVELLRKFRNEFLLTSKLGREFVETYYKISPPIADFIRDHSALRALTRGVLLPVIAWAQFCLDYGFVSGVLLLLVMGLVLRRILGQAKLIFSQRYKRSP
jgi:hypothetical protein